MHKDCDHSKQGQIVFRREKYGVIFEVRNKIRFRIIGEIWVTGRRVGWTLGQTDYCHWAIRIISYGCLCMLLGFGGLVKPG